MTLSREQATVTAIQKTIADPEFKQIFSEPVWQLEKLFKSLKDKNYDQMIQQLMTAIKKKLVKTADHDQEVRRYLCIAFMYDAIKKIGSDAKEARIVLSEKHQKLLTQMEGSSVEFLLGAKNLCISYRQGESHQTEFMMYGGMLTGGGGAVAGLSTVGKGALGWTYCCTATAAVGLIMCCLGWKASRNRVADQQQLVAKAIDEACTTIKGYVDQYFPTDLVSLGIYKVDDKKKSANNNDDVKTPLLKIN